MKKANISWKGWKYVLRHQAIDKYLTDAERKSNVPKFVKPEDWVKFVDISSMSAALVAREAGKIDRSKLKSPHTMVRKGQARVAAELVRFVHISSFCNYTIFFYRWLITRHVKRIRLNE